MFISICIAKCSEDTHSGVSFAAACNHGLTLAEPPTVGLIAWGVGEVLCSAFKYEFTSPHKIPPVWRFLHRHNFIFVVATISPGAYLFPTILFVICLRILRRDAIQCIFTFMSGAKMFHIHQLQRNWAANTSGCGLSCSKLFLIKNSLSAFSSMCNC